MSERKLHPIEYVYGGVWLSIIALAFASLAGIPLAGSIETTNGLTLLGLSMLPLLVAST